MSFPQILTQNGLTTENISLLLLLAEGGKSVIAGFVKKFGFFLKKTSEESLVEEKIRQILISVINQSNYPKTKLWSTKGSRAQKLFKYLSDGDLEGVAKVLTSAWRSYAKNFEGARYKAELELHAELLEAEGIEVEGVREGVRRAGDDEPSAENIILSENEKENLKKLYEKKYNIKDKAYIKKSEPQPQLLELEPKLDDYIYQKPANNLNYRSHLLFYCEGA